MVAEIDIPTKLIIQFKPLRYMTSNTLIAFFSRKGFNYVNGSIINLPVGNTEVIARKIHLLTGGGSSLFQILPENPYPEYYTETTTLAQKELRENARPGLCRKLDDMTSYNTIFLGYPNWWGTMPMAVFTFLEQYNFSGKRIAPFCTHEGSGLGSSERDIKNLCPGAIVVPGLAIRGGEVGQADRLIKEWLQANDLIQNKTLLC